MSTLVLIRHGQASLASADYDVLSPTGVLQSQALGRHLAARGDAFDRLFTGPLRRHVDTAAHLRAAAADGGLALPEPEPAADFDEFPALEILARCVATTGERDPEVARLSAAMTSARGDAREFPRAFDRLFQAMMRHWLAGAFDGLGIEPYADFQARIERGLEAVLRAAGRGARIAVVTSAGPVGAALRRALHLQPWDGMRAAFVVANTAMSELWARPGELTLSSFNGVPHLERALVTMR